MGEMADYYRELEEEIMWNEMEQISLMNRQDKEADYKWWRQKDGSKIRITKMTNSHINNCIAMIDRNDWREHWREPLLQELERRKT